MRRWHVVNTLAKTLSPAAEAFRYFILESGEAFLAKHFSQGAPAGGRALDPALSAPGGCRAHARSPFSTRQRLLLCSAPQPILASAHG